MINPKELRLGNYIKRLSCPRASEPEIIQVEAICDDMINMGDCFNDGLCELEYYEPIPLTEEWLLSCGFSKKSKDSSIFLKEEDDFTYMFLGDNFSRHYKHQKLFEFVYLATIEYVHQLQNFYWCLNGKELEIINKTLV